MSNTVWVIEQGDYSDYRVSGVFSTRENAERIAAILGGDAAVAEWELDPTIADLDAGRTPYVVIMSADGTVEKLAVPHGDGWSPAYFAPWRRSTVPAFRGQNALDAVNARVWAEDDKHAVKIVNEKRLAMIAAGEIAGA